MIDRISNAGSLGKIDPSYISQQLLKRKFNKQAMRLRIKDTVKNPEVSLYLGIELEKSFTVGQQKHKSEEVGQFGLASLCDQQCSFVS